MARGGANRRPNQPEQLTMLFDLEPYLPLNLFLIGYMLTIAALALWAHRRTR